MTSGERPGRRERASRFRRLAGLALSCVLTCSPARSEIAPGRAAVLDAFADPFSLGHSGALFEADPHATPDDNSVALSSDAALHDARDLASLPGGRWVIVDRDADPSGLGEDPNMGNGHGAVFIAAAADASIRLLSDGTDYPAGRPPGWASIFADPQGVAVDLDGNILVADRDADPSQLGPDASGFSGHGAIFRVDAATGSVTLLSDGSLSDAGAPPGGAASWFEDPSDVTVGSGGRIFVMESFADPTGLGGSGAVFELDPSSGRLRLVATSPLFDFPVSLTARPDGLLALSDQLADPAGDGSRGAVFLIDPDAATPAVAVVSLLTDPRFRSLMGLGAAADSSLFLADAFADPLGLGRLGSVWRIPVGSPLRVAATSSGFRALSGVAVSPPTGAAPTLTAVTPSFVGQEDALTLTLDGTGFEAPAELELGEGIRVAALRVLSGVLAEADVTVAFDATTGPREARFINPDWQAARLPGALEVTAAARPIVVSVSPSTGVQGEMLTATVTGANFADPVSVDLGPQVAVLAARLLGSTLLELDLRIDLVAAPGLRDLTITNPDSRWGTLTGAFEVLEPSGPDLREVVPFLLARGETIEVELRGSNFSEGMEADFGPDLSVGKLQVLSSGAARCRVHTYPMATSGSRDGRVTNPDARAGLLVDAVQVSDAPVVRLVGLRIVDAPGGDGESDLDPGEIVGLDFELHAPGRTLASSVQLRVINPAPGLGLSVLRAGVPFPDIPAGGSSRRPAAPYPEVSLSPDAKCGDSYPLVIEIEAGGALVAREHIELPVGRVATWQRKPVSDGLESGGRRGAAVALADLDGDGVADLVVGAPREDGSGVFDAGRVLATAGATDDPLWTAEGSENNGRFGSALAAVSDVDGDGLEDLLVGAPREAGGGGRAYLLSGLDGSVLAFVEGLPGDELGAAVALAGDRNIDGRSELAVGAPGASAGRGRVLILDSSDFRELGRLEGAAGERLGAALAFLGDGDDDGRDDLVVAAPGADSETGAVLLFRGDGSVLRLSGADYGASAGEGFGLALAAGRDLDADGAPDLLVGVPGSSGGRGRALVLDGRDGSLLAEVRGAAAGDELGRALGLLPDLDGDGIAELVLGSPGALAEDGRLEIRSGGSGNLLFLREGTMGSAGRLGESVSAGRDSGGDAFPDLLAGAPLAGVPGVPLAGRSPAFKSEVACRIFEPCLPDALEPNDSFEMARDIGYGSQSGLRVCIDDVDVFRIDPAADRRALVRILFRHADGDLDATLHDAGQVLVDASLSLDDDEELGPFGPGGGPWFVRIVGFEGASNDFELHVLDPDSCPPTLELRDLRVSKGNPGQIVISWSPSEDPCHESDPGQPAYAVFASSALEGPSFIEVTVEDLDGDLTNTFHVRTPAPGLRFYLVADIGRASERGPLGHFGL